MLTSHNSTSTSSSGCGVTEAPSSKDIGAQQQQQSSGEGTRKVREIEECVAWMLKLQEMKLLKMRDMARSIGLPCKVLLGKLQDGTIDPVHLRKTHEYLRDILQLGDEFFSSGMQSMDERARPRKRIARCSPVLTNHTRIPCPLMAMGLAGLECSETCADLNEVLQHVACHVAVLWKRVQELEMAVTPFLQQQQQGVGALLPRIHLD